MQIWDLNFWLSVIYNNYRYDLIVEYSGIFFPDLKHLYALENFSMIESPSGWVLSATYNLLNTENVFPDNTEEMALTLSGKKCKLKL